MIRIEILQATPPKHPDGWEPIGTITANDNTLTTHGDQDKLAQILTLTVPDPGTRTGVIAAHEHPEAWAANLPAVLRGPALIARITAT